MPEATLFKKNYGAKKLSEDHSCSMAPSYLDHIGRDMLKKGRGEGVSFFSNRRNSRNLYHFELAASPSYYSSPKIAETVHHIIRSRHLSKAWKYSWSNKCALRSRLQVGLELETLSLMCGSLTGCEHIWILIVTLCWKQRFFQRIKNIFCKFSYP